jgi:hypothetical protein
MNCDCVSRSANVGRHPADDMSFTDVVDILNFLVLQNKKMEKDISVLERKIEVLENARQKQ